MRKEKLKKIMSFLSQGEYTYVRDFVESNRHLDGLSARQLREANVDQLLRVERAVEVPLKVVLNIYRVVNIMLLGKRD